MSALPTRAELFEIAKQALFNLEMSRAVNDDRKTQTRRTIMLPHEDCRFDCFEEPADDVSGAMLACFYDDKELGYLFIKPRYQIGDILWVREPAKITEVYFQPDKNDVEIEYKYTSDDDWERRISEKVTLPERLMTVCGNAPNWVLNLNGVPNGCIKEMARTFLRVTNVRVERLQDISDEDIEKEGIFILDSEYPLVSTDLFNKLAEIRKNKWIKLWDSTAQDGYKWSDNPYVFVYEFEKVDCVT